MILGVAWGGPRGSPHALGHVVILGVAWGLPLGHVVILGVASGPATTVVSFMSLRRLLNLQKVLNLDQSKTQPTATDLQDNAEYTLETEVFNTNIL